MNALLGVSNNAQTQCLASKPVPVLNFVHVAIRKIAAGQDISDWVMGEYTNSTTDHSTGKKGR